jgi:ribonuclease HIII
MTDKTAANLAAFEQWLAEKGWRVFEQREIDYGRQVTVTDGAHRLPVNFYTSGAIVPGGKAGDMKTAITEWANLQRSGLGAASAGGTAQQRQNRSAKYLVIPDNMTKIRDEVVPHLPGEIMFKDPTGPADVYRVEVRRDDQRVTITQYSSGTLLVQGLSGPHFDTVCEALDEHLAQSFSERASRFIPGNDAERAAATSYLDSADSENEAARWLLEQITQNVRDFLFPNDKHTLLAAAGVRNAVQQLKQTLPDYSVVVMPFAKAYEGFLIRLAAFLNLTDETTLRQKATAIGVGGWLEEIRKRLPDTKRYSEIGAALEAAWECRHKAVHSDFGHPLGVLKAFQEAEQEIAVILRAMTRAYRVFVEEGVDLQPSQEAQHEPKSTPASQFQCKNVDRDALRDKLLADGWPLVSQPEGRKNLWEITQQPDLTVVAPRATDGLIVVSGQRAPEFRSRYSDLLDGQSPPADRRGKLAMDTRIGVDESGKGDLFGPLVVAAVALTTDAELALARHGVRDSKSLSDSQIAELATRIRDLCESETLVLMPPEYNLAHERHGRNLNRLLAWGHARVIAKLSSRVNASHAISDQFGDESLVLEALAAEGCTIPLEQRPRAETDLAVAAASILARAEFVEAIEEYTSKSGIEIPLGSSSPQVKAVGIQIYRRWGRKGLERIAKMHFKTINEITSEGG